MGNFLREDGVDNIDFGRVPGPFIFGIGKQPDFK